MDNTRILTPREMDLLFRAIEIYYNNNAVAKQRDEINNLGIVLRQAKVVELHENFKEEKVAISNNQIRSSHYGGPDNPYEAIKVIDAWNANFNLGNAIKYICRVSVRNINTPQKQLHQAQKDKDIEDLKKAKTYLEFEIEKLEKLK